ncbi:MAG: prenyltransferase [Bacteroidales bacterium]|nr:prenyltransferase [Bacteroidales bacterium]
MEKPNAIKIWMAQIRANFLILAVLLVAIGLAFSCKYPSDSTVHFNILRAVFLIIGVVLSHISVNLFNEYYDYKSKIDFNTNRTPFTGGSGMLTNGFTNSKRVLIIAILSLLISLGIGIYFTIVSNWILVILIAIGAFSVILYTNYLAKIILGELFSGLSLGSLVVIGTYIAMTATQETPFNKLLPLEVILVSIPPGILTALLLLINQFPDAEADKLGGRKHLVIKFGKKKAAYIYTFGIVLTFGTILILPVFNIASTWIYLALLPIPLAIKACITAIQHGDDNQKLVPALGSNVITVLATDFLLAASILIAMI